MPVLMVSSIRFLENYSNTSKEEKSTKGFYCIDISKLIDTYRHMEEGKSVDIFLIAFMDEKDKIIKKFEPFKELSDAKILRKEYIEYDNSNIFSIKIKNVTIKYYVCLPTDISDKFGIGQNYKAVFIITKYENQPLASGYFKYIGDDSEKYQKLFKDMGTKLLILLYSIDNETLHEAIFYVFKAYRKLKNKEIEDSRTWLRKALETLEKIFNYEIKVSKDESEEYPKYICKLIKALKNFVNYGGPHEGPAPEHTTKFILYITKKLIEHLSYSIYKGVISIDFNKPSNSNPCKENKKENQND
jgi:bifunctional DNA-binding transcriptional regulator/antitoxin component of YhaV-PrlF toxin-antitoxin module